MKKILWICSTIIIILMGFVTYEYTAHEDTVFWENWGSSSICKKIYINNSDIQNKNVENIKKHIIEVSNKHSVCVIKTGYISQNNKLILRKGIHIPADSSISLSVMMKSHKYFDMKNLKDEMVLSTVSNENSVFDAFDDNNVEFMNLKTAWNKYDIDGDYIISSNSDTNLSKFINELSKKTKIPYDNLTVQKNFHAVKMSTASVAYMICIPLILLLYAAINVFYTISQNKKIAILLLNGLSAKNIWWDLTSPQLFITTLLGLIYNTFLIYKYKPVSSIFVVRLFGELIILLGIQLLVSLLTFIYIKNQKLNNLIKGKRNIKFLRATSKILQLSFLSFGMIVIIFLSGIITDLCAENKLIKSWDKYSNYAILSAISIGNDIESISGKSNKLTDDFSKLYDYVNDKGAYYFSYNKISTDSYKDTEGVSDFVKKNPYEINLLEINKNYFDTLKLKDIKGNNIVINNNDSNTIILIPKDKENESEKINKLIEAYCISNNNNLKDFGYPVNNNSNIKLYYYENINLFNLAPTSNDDAKEIVNPVITIYTKNNMNSLDKSGFQHCGLDNPVKLPLKLLNGANKQALDNIIKKCDLNDNNLRFKSIGDYFANQKAYTKHTMYIGIGICSILFIICSFISWQELAISFEMRKKELAVKKLCGYSLLSKHKKRILLDCIFLILSTFAGVIISHNNLNIYSLVLVLIYISLYVLVEYIIININENKTLNNIIKGA
ncbi:DUF1430 domain-containing protein [Clostridium botulinum D/C]|uniref:DUF1430 domain-containing protein n=1 Tax=Clostridium botulinum TaxID=1491 RepID=UPI001E333B3E|nr:DUF1430 domain-containing protein [Clostridium botulinum]MCD3352095.1 DUF1430 domain-containing protein [Clostridium botulinum D/C]MCD3361058.1 DUF1430 domain-containing protein [Clostridium botulinum D/C]MCD3363114.1 DUF1430 domain-containing protein [Clostridium botulinum D/C]MCD3366813.1 DUF1430 domain-containing protein [Clostridium botulinum D/C]